MDLDLRESVLLTLTLNPLSATMSVCYVVQRVVYTATIEVGFPWMR